MPPSLVCRRPDLAFHGRALEGQDVAGIDFLGDHVAGPVHGTETGAEGQVVARNRVLGRGRGARTGRALGVDRLQRRLQAVIDCVRVGGAEVLAAAIDGGVPEVIHRGRRGGDRQRPGQAQVRIAQFGIGRGLAADQLEGLQRRADRAVETGHRVDASRGLEGADRLVLVIGVVGDVAGNAEAHGEGGHVLPLAHVAFGRVRRRNEHHVVGYVGAVEAGRAGRPQVGLVVVLSDVGQAVAAAAGGYSTDYGAGPGGAAAVEARRRRHRVGRRRLRGEEGGPAGPVGGHAAEAEAEIGPAGTRHRSRGRDPVARRPDRPSAGGRSGWCRQLCYR
jgi:hypothetical protein